MTATVAQGNGKKATSAASGSRSTAEKAISLHILRIKRTFAGGGAQSLSAALSVAAAAAAVAVRSSVQHWQSITR